MKLDSLRTLYIHELNDLYDAEIQLVKVLPKLVKAASSDDLRLVFEQHLELTEEHVDRLENMLTALAKPNAPITCKGIKGLIEEAEEMIKADGDPGIKDAGLISAAKRLEHYEIAAYGCSRTFAEMLGEKDSVRHLQTTLDEELEMDASLTDLAESLMGTDATQA